MGTAEKELIMQLAMDEITEEEFLRQYPFPISEGYMIAELQTIRNEKDAEGMEQYLTLGDIFGLPASTSDFLAEILLDNWHTRHEEIVRLFQFKFPQPQFIDNLKKAAELRFEYMDDVTYIEFFRKCLYAIHATGTDKATEIISEYAQSAYTDKATIATEVLNS